MFPNRAAVIRLVGAVRAEQADMKLLEAAHDEAVAHDPVVVTGD